MTDQLIKFNTALLAKNLGFDAKCLNAFLLKMKPDRVWDELQKELNTGEEIGIPTGRNNEQLVRVHSQWSNNKTQPQIVARPTQSLLVKWLRETHKIIVWVEWDNFVGWQSGNEKYLAKIANGGPCPWHPGCLVYEEALEEGLVQALKCLETILKNNKREPVDK